MNVAAKAFHQATRDDQLARPAIVLMPRHLQNRIHRFLLRALDERAGVDHNDVSIFGAGNQLRPGLCQHAHHDFAIDQVLGTSQADKADLRWRRGRFFSDFGFVVDLYCGVRRRHVI